MACWSLRFVLFLLAFLGVNSSAAFVPLPPSHGLAVATRTFARPTTAASSCCGSNRPDRFLGAAATATTIIEREPTVIPGPLVVEPLPAIERRHDDVDSVPSKQRRGQGSEAWEVRIYNDGLNTREHVARSLVQVTGLSELQAYQTMMQAHQNGIAAVGRWVYEVAEMYHDALKKKGIVCDIIPVDEE